MSATDLRSRLGSDEERVAQARSLAASPEMLTWLAADPAPAVRAAVAANIATPPQAGLLLAEDADTAVRRALARRVGRLAPNLSAEATDKLARITAAIMAKLVEDAAVEVRAALAEVVKEMPKAPRELILKLAGDAAVPVAGPVLKLSPLLTEADLLALIAAPPAPVTRRLVAARPKLSETVTEALAGSGDVAAIAVMLGNPSAAIREATLDRLAAGSRDEPTWQAALARRPKLPPSVARALGAIITSHLLEVLAARPDLPPGLADRLRPRIAARLAAAEPSRGQAREAAQAGDRAGLLGVLAEATGMPRGRIDAALALRSPRAVVALCWRAGWTAELAEQVQAALGVPAARMIKANAEGGWTLSPAELQWQVEMIEDLPA